MSDVDFAKVNQQRNKIDIIDEAWVQDTLSVDDINESKHELELEGDDADEIFNTEQESEWNDLGLDYFVMDSQPQTIAPQVNSQPQQASSEVQS